MATSGGKAPVVSRRVLVKADKVGHVRSVRSPSARADAATSLRVEETATTRAYVRQLGLSPPPPPPMRSSTPPTSPRVPHYYHHDPPPVSPIRYDDDDHVVASSRRRKDDADDAANIVVAAILVVALVALLVWASLPTYAVLDRVSWAFVGDVHALRLVTEEDWVLPDDAVDVLASVEQQRTTREVLDHTETLCRTEQHSTTTISHYEQQCREELTGWTDAREVYSHTEEVCYADDTCEEKDVYTKLPAEPIYGTRCKQVPIFVTVQTPREKCDLVKHMRVEPVMGTRWTYTAKRWVKARSVTFASLAGHTTDMVRDALGPDETYVGDGWRYHLHFDNGTTVVEVDQSVYEAHVSLVGQTVRVP